jgi:hypothetical protein
MEASNKRSLGSTFSDAKTRHKLARDVKSPIPCFPLVLPPAPAHLLAPSSNPTEAIDYQSPNDFKSALNELTNDPERQAKARLEALSDAQELIGKLQPSPIYQHSPDPLPSIELPPSPAATPAPPAATPPEAPAQHGTPLFLPNVPVSGLSKSQSPDCQNPSPRTVKIPVPGLSKFQSPDCLNAPVSSTAPAIAVAPPAPAAPRKSVSALIADILAIPSRTPSPSQFQFHLDHASAIHNGQILQAHNFNLGRAIRSDGNSPLRFGSEFRPVSVLEPLLGIHPLWPRIRALLLEGSHFCADPLPREECSQQVEACLSYGNHKGAIKDPDKLFDLLDEDVTHGFIMPLPLSMALQIPGLLLSPMNIARQNTIDELGNIVPKDRLTHDHSMEFLPRSSINSRSRLEDHEPCHFGHALSRFFHILVNLRLRHPTRRILMSKIDWKAAFRRCHLDVDTALQCCTHLENLLLCALRLTFGGKPCPPDWSCLSDTGSDIANDLVADPTWDPSTLCSPHQAKMLPVPPSTHLVGELPHPGKPLLFDFPEEEESRLAKFDNYLDDLLAAGVEIDDTIARMAAAGPLALHALGRPLSDVEPIPRDDNLSLKKFKAEALPEETKTVLGWLIDTWSLSVKLPQDKYIAWSRSIRAVLQAKKISYPDLDTLIGRLNHLCRVIRFASHFLGRLRHLLQTFNGRKYASRHFDEDISKDLLLWLKCLKKAASGMSLNILVLRVATHLYRNDAAFHGIGGYSNRGRAWRYDIPEELRLRASINLLEFIGSILGPWIDFVEGNLPPESCIFSQGDNTTAASWLQKTNFASNKPAHLKVARRLANLLLESESQLTNEWIAGESNPLADSLSRDTHLSPADHTAFLLSVLPQQMPDGFAIRPLPEEISSWLGCILRLLPASSEPCPQPTRSKLWSGIAGSHTSAPSTAPTTLSSILSTLAPASNASSPLSSAVSPKPFEQANFNPEAVKAWLQEQSRTTSDRWFKPSGLISGEIPRATPMVDYPAFYQGSTPASKARIPLLNENALLASAS